jgi:hypothetical protein
MRIFAARNGVGAKVGQKEGWPSIGTASQVNRYNVITKLRYSRLADYQLADHADILAGDADEVGTL